jgi:hypothetical protein
MTRTIHVAELVDITASNRWLEGVVEPIRRSTRMSWSLLQSAAALGHELGIFAESADVSEGDRQTRTTQRRRRLRLLLYVYVNQVASRRGQGALIPLCLTEAPQAASWRGLSTDAVGLEWVALMSLSVDLTRLSQISSDLLFPSATATKTLINDGSYRRVLEHLSPMFEAWWDKAQSLNGEH